MSSNAVSINKDKMGQETEKEKTCNMRDGLHDGLVGGGEERTAFARSSLVLSFTVRGLAQIVRALLIHCIGTSSRNG